MRIIDTSTDQTFETEFSQVFDRNNEYWGGPLYNTKFIEVQEVWMNKKLKDRGHLFLNEVYDALNFPRTPNGQLVGWLAGYDAVVLRVLPLEDGSLQIDFNVTQDNVMYNKI